MRRLLRRCLREPLLHFLLLGAAIFGLNAWLQDAELDSEAVIEVTAADIERLSELWRRQWQREPTTEELRGLVESHVREEILYREAIKMGLDRNDIVVRRRLAQKMEFLTEDLARPEDPSEEDLRRFYAEHSDRYSEPARVSLGHVYFSRDRRGKDAEQDARRALAELAAHAEATGRADEMGDPFMLQHVYVQVSQRELGGIFGQDFAKTVMELPVGRWEGPVASAHGVHAVRVEERIEARQRPLEEVREKAREDYRQARREEANRTFYARLRERYRILIDEKAFGMQPMAGVAEIHP